MVKAASEDMEARNFDESLTITFERVAATFPSRIALGSDVWEPTYWLLNETANRVAHQLIAHGVALGDRVAVLMLHDAPMVAAVLGILKAGGVVLSLDTGDPISRLKMLVEDAEPGAILTDVHNRSLAAEFGQLILDFEEASAMGPDENPSIEIPPQQTAFLTYTSGTTGKPKGVMQTHRQLQRAAAAHSEAMQFTEYDRIPLFAMISTSQGAVGLWWILLNGAMLCPFSLKARGIAGVADWIIGRRLTAYVSSASIFRTLAKTIDARMVFKNVRAVRLASESVTADDFKLFQQHFPPNSIFVHTLSSSETSNIAWSRWTQEDTIPHGKFPVGHFSRDTEVLLLDDDGQPVAHGEIGDIVVKSRYLANGYWRDPELTAERFSPYLDDVGTRLVRNGDLGRINSDGLLEFCGRKDDRIKIRGNRIEPLDIERTIERVPGIERAAVVAVARGNHEPMLVAFVVKKLSASLTARRLRHAAGANLPSHMVPSKVVFLDSLPYNKGNKIDREALRQYPFPSRSDWKGPQPETETESLVANIFAEVFDLTDVNGDDDFFDLGGDSLSAAIVAARIHETTGIELGLKEIADEPTVAALSSLLDRRRGSAPDILPPVVPVPRGSTAPASFYQELVWNFPREFLVSATVVRSYRIIGALDINILKECLDYLVDRHEILRTTFSLVNGSVAQIIHPFAPLDFSFIDLVDTHDPDGQADAIFRKQDSQEIDLESLPLMRHILIKIANENYRLARIISHVIYDGATSHILNTELAILYEAKQQKLDAVLPRKPALQFADYATWQREVMQPEHPYVQAAIGWWKNSFKNAKFTNRLPFRRLSPRTGLNPCEGVLQWSVEARTAALLDHVARSVRATPFAIRLAAFAALVADVTSNSTVVIGTYFNNRNKIETQNIVGPFVNTTPLVFSFDATKTFFDWSELIRDRINETRVQSELSYENVKQQLLVQGIVAPEIQIVFVMAGDHSDQYFGNLVVKSELWDIGKMPWGCMFYFDERKSENSRVHFDAGLYDRNEMREMLRRYLRLLELAAHKPELTTGELLILTGRRPLRWRFRNYAERIYGSSTLLKSAWRKIRKLVSS